MDTSHIENDFETTGIERELPKSIAEIKNKVSICKKKENEIKSLESLCSHDSLTTDEVSTVEAEIENIQASMPKGDNRQRPIDDLLLKLENSTMQKEDLKDAGENYFCDKKFVKHTINAFNSRAKQGKSTFLSSFASKMLSERIFYNVIHFDFDNSKASLAERGFGTILEKHQGSYYYLSAAKTNKEEMMKSVKDLKRYELSKTLVIIENLKDIAGMLDLAKQNDVQKLFEEIILPIRDRAMVGMLCITNHLIKTKEDNISAGSWNIGASLDNTYMIQSQKDPLTKLIQKFACIPQEECRFMVQPSYWKFANVAIEEMNESAFVDDGEREIIQAIVSILEGKGDTKITNGELFRGASNVTNAGESKVREVIKKYQNIYWEFSLENLGAKKGLAHIYSMLYSETSLTKLTELGIKVIKSL